MKYDLIYRLYFCLLSYKDHFCILLKPILIFFNMFEYLYLCGNQKFVLHRLLPPLLLDILLLRLCLFLKGFYRRYLFLSRIWDLNDILIAFFLLFFFSWVVFFQLGESLVLLDILLVLLFPHFRSRPPLLLQGFLFLLFFSGVCFLI